MRMVTTMTSSAVSQTERLVRFLESLQEREERHPDLKVVPARWLGQRLPEHRRFCRSSKARRAQWCAFLEREGPRHEPQL